MHFIISTDSSKPPGDSRRLIRSHVMKGKNRGKVHLDRKSSIPSRIKQTAKANTANDTADAAIHHVISRTNSPTSPICLPVDMLGNSINLVISVSKVAKQLLFPLEVCIFFDRRAESWISPLKFDKAYLDVIVCFAEAFLGNNNTLTTRQCRVLARATRTLNKRISDDHDHLQLADSTLATILNLTVFAMMQRDFAQARCHLLGLRLMIKLRGGVSSFESNKKLLVEILRSDIGLSLVQSTAPLLTDLVDLKCSMVAAPNRYQYETDPADRPGLPLTQANSALLVFSRLIEDAYGNQQLITLNVYLEYMTGIFYGLLCAPSPTVQSDKLLRLALLSFSSIVFLQWRRLGLEYTWLLSEFATTLTSFPLTSLSQQLRLWILVIAAISCEHTACERSIRALLAEELANQAIASLSGLKDCCRGSPWISFLLDQPAEAAMVNTLRV